MIKDKLFTKYDSLHHSHTHNENIIMFSQIIKTMRKHTCSSCENFIVGMVERLFGKSLGAHMAHVRLIVFWAGAMNLFEFIT